MWHTITATYYPTRTTRNNNTTDAEWSFLDNQKEITLSEVVILYSACSML